MNKVPGIISVNHKLHFDHLISEEDKQAVLGFTATSRPYPQYATIAQLFAEQAAAYPEKTALVCKHDSLTYDQLNRRSNLLARRLQTEGIGKNSIAGLLLEKSIDLIVGILAILKAGGTYLPLDPDYPAERIDFILRDSGCRLVLTQTKFKDLASGDAKKIYLDSPTLYQGEDSDIESGITSDDLAYIIYTSGTTGRPKGSMIRQKSVVRLVRNTNYIEFTSEDRCLFTGAVVFDVCTFEIWGPLLNGGCLYIPEREEILDPRLLGKSLTENEITILWLTSSLFTQIAESRTDIFSGLKYLLVGGDVLSPPHINKVRRDNAGLKVINGYGPTENTTFTTCYRIERDFDQNIPIGKPISNTTVYIFDENLNLQPVGIIGELYTGGEGLSAGYLNRDDLNSTKFIDNPYNPGERLYRTGDFARWLPDGNLEFHGRIDNQIKIRGFRVELEEIETMLRDIEGVIEAVVKTYSPGEGDTRLVAFLNVRDTFTRAHGEIAGILKSRMPSYMIPSVMLPMHGFPLTINGKIDREALKYTANDLPDKESNKKAVFTATEEKICKIWSEVLKTGNILPEDNFFEIGGNSLLAMGVQNRIEEILKISILYKDVLKYPTLSGLGKFLDNKPLSAETAPELFHQTNRKELPLTKSQARMWLINRLNPANPNYILSFTYRLSGTLDLDIFHKSVDLLFQRHHILFSSINEKDGIPFCNIKNEKAEIKSIEFNESLPEADKIKVLEFINNDSRQAMDIQNGPLYRLFLFKLADEEYYFNFAIHHIIFDGWSWQVFINDLSEIYNSLLANREINLQKLEYQQYDFADLEKRTERISDNEKLAAYWRNRLSGCSTVLNFPYDFPRKNTTTGNGDREYICFSAELSSGLRQLSKQEGTGLFSTMLTTYAILMHKYSGDHDLNLGSPVANRSHSSMEQVIGMFVNTVVIRLRFDHEMSFRSLLKTTNEFILDAITHQDLSFDKIVEIVKPERVSDINPVFQLAFAWDENLNVPLHLNGVKSKKLLLHGGVSPFDITCSLLDGGEMIEGEIEYNTDLIKKDTIVRLRDNYINLVAKLLSNYDLPVSSIPLISEEEKQIVLGFTDTSTPYPQYSTIAQLFVEQVAAHPEKIALVCKHDSLTYDQLNRKSDMLAGRLKAEGIGKNSIAGLLVEKSIDLIVGILAILKAGGSYLPLDPDYPAERIDFILRDSGCRLVLTQTKFRDLASGDAKKIYLDSPSSYQGEDSDIEIGITSEDLAYIMYTSGTTGRPKGSMIRQKSVVRLVRNTNYIDITSEDRFLLTGAVVFDASTFEIWGSLLNGGCLYIPEREEILDPRLLGRSLKENEITILWLTSSLFTQIAENRTDIFNKLKYLLVGGDVLSPPHINKVRRDNASLKVINGYGPTENTTFTACYRIERDFDQNIPIGKPMSNTTVYIFDENLNLQPVGIIGELYTGGEGLSAGYLNRDDLNSTKFIDNPYNPGEKLYRTGDFARWLPDGNLEFHGRVDNQIKIRGFRVELEEIETMLRDIEGVIEAVVKTYSPGEGDTRLVAFLNVRDTFTRAPGEIAGILKSRMPSYMIPSVMLPMHGFPLTINGKIDREALRYTASEGADNESKNNVVFTATEEKICKIWSEVLKTENILPDDNFFEIGGNSLLAIAVLSKLVKEFKLELGLRTLFDNPRVRDLSDFIIRAGESDHEPDWKTWPKEAENVMSVNKRGTKIPLVLVYCGNFSYFLSRNLGQDQPVYGVFDDGWLNGSRRRHGSVESLATDYLSQLEKVLPPGPFIIGGHSFGGVVAYEMAIQLQKKGHDVPFIALFDSMSAYAHVSVWSRIKAHKIFKSILRPAAKRMWQFVKMPLFNALFLAGKSLPDSIRTSYLVTNYLILLYKYRPEKFRGESLLFRVKEDNSSYRQLYGWEFLCSKVKNIVLDADHMSMMRDKRFSKIIAEEIEKHLRSAREH